MSNTIGGAATGYIHGNTTIDIGIGGQTPRAESQDHGNGLAESVQSGMDSVIRNHAGDFGSIAGAAAQGRATASASAFDKFNELSQAPCKGENGFLDDGILSRSPEIVEKLGIYLDSIDSNLSINEMKSLINTGEHLVNAITRGQSNGGTVTLTLGGHTCQLESSMHTTRAISWYLTAKTAELEVNTGKDHMVTQGSMLMKDPGNKLFDFLNAAPTSYGRISSHFNERVESNGRRPEHRGIEDFDNKLPGGKGSILFNKLKNGELFMKFESAGWPEVFRMSGERGATNAEKIGNVFRNLGRCIQHIGHWVTSRFNSNAEGPGVHREHAHKDGAGVKVFKPFKKVMDHIEGAHKGNKDDPKDMVAKAKKMGTAYMFEELTNLRDNIGTHARFKIKEGHESDFAEDYEAAEKSVKDFLEKQGPDFGVDRKGMETHISLDTNPLKKESASATENSTSEPIETYPPEIASAPATENRTSESIEIEEA
ncbi:MAG TPA: hypothetical protein VK196_05070 [Magnetospirillum sp.]|nr:hypothetical protein [Magnetospirillum sp.]